MDPNWMQRITVNDPQSENHPLFGKTIGAVRWMSDEEVQQYGFTGRARVVECTDGTIIFATNAYRNEAGQLCTNIGGKGQLWNYGVEL